MKLEQSPGSPVPPPRSRRNSLLSALESGPRCSTESTESTNTNIGAPERTAEEQRDADADEFEALVDQYGIEGVLLGNIDFEVTKTPGLNQNHLLSRDPFEIR